MDIKSKIYGKTCNVIIIDDYINPLARSNNKMDDKRPEIVKDKHLRYLDNLREMGVTNMYGAVPYLLKVFKGLNQEEGVIVLRYWMDTFSERHKS